MSKTIKPGDLAEAIRKQLGVYEDEVVERVNEAGRASIKRLKKLTKASAPVASGSYRKNISTAEEKDPATGDTKFIWYVKKPDHRLTHLLVHGHATRDGGRTKADPFLRKALDTVLPEYEQAVKEAVQND